MPFVCGALISLMSSAAAGGGPLGIDHRWKYDESGIWSRSNQNFLRYGALAADVGIALWEGGDSRLGRAAWQSIDSTALGTLSAETTKRWFGRVRPRDSNDPNQWFKRGHYSFPSSEVAETTAIITPYVLEYGRDHPAVYLLELVPAYDAIARMKVQAHWQTDVLAGFAIGTVTGLIAHKRDSPLILSLLPRGFAVGLKKQF